jgi:(1->4)-alpha-D-glucan 1-alpha-D-glucosylmutase
VVGLARLDGPDAVIAVVPRLTARLAGLTGRFALGEAAWEQTWVALGDDRLAGVYRDRFTGLTVASEHRDGAAVLPVPALFAHFPVALLEREGGLP